MNYEAAKSFDLKKQPNRYYYETLFNNTNIKVIARLMNNVDDLSIHNKKSKEKLMYYNYINGLNFH